MRHADGYTLNVRAILVAKPHRIRLARRPLLLRPLPLRLPRLLRRGGQKCKRQRKTKDRPTPVVGRSFSCEVPLAWIERPDGVM
jgi:hypothetical protein